jgi:thermolabile hemolysin
MKIMDIKKLVLIPCGFPLLVLAEPISSTSVSPSQSEPSSVQSKNTYTYIKCAYRKNPNAFSDVTSSWQWGLSENNQYAVVNGRWYSNAILANMFYTEASFREIKDICISTLSKAGITYADVYPYASDHTLSYYYTFWSEGQHLPSVRIGATDLERMVVFGDSLSDTINVYNGSYGTVPNSKSWYFGHFTNGLTWHEYLTGYHMNIPSYSWATGNAHSGNDIIFSGLNQQIDSFELYAQYSSYYNPAKTLFFVLFGGNDLITGNKNPDDVLKSFRTGIPRLIANGAKQIVLFTLPDFSLIPAVLKWSAEDRNKLKEKVQSYNAKLNQYVEELKEDNKDVKIIIANLYSYFGSLIANPDKFGYRNTRDACLNVSGSGFDYITGRSPTSECINSNAAFLFWDNMHPTAKTHLNISQMIFDEIKLSL